MNTNSSYKDDFVGDLILENQEANQMSKNSAIQNYESTGVFPPSSFFLGHSTSKKDFKSFVISKRPKIEKGKTGEIINGLSWTGQYSTTYNDSFTGEHGIRVPKKKEAFGKKPRIV